MENKDKDDARPPVGDMWSSGPGSIGGEAQCLYFQIENQGLEEVGGGLRGIGGQTCSRSHSEFGRFKARKGSGTPSPVLFAQLPEASS